MRNQKEEGPSPDSTQTVHLPALGPLPVHPFVSGVVRGLAPQPQKLDFQTQGKKKGKARRLHKRSPST